MYVVLGFLIITVFAIPICLLSDRIEKRKKDAWLKKVLSGEINPPPPKNQERYKYLMEI
jgi:hypothetical protein